MTPERELDNLLFRQTYQHGLFAFHTPSPSRIACSVGLFPYTCSALRRIALWQASCHSLLANGRIDSWKKGRKSIPLRLGRVIRGARYHSRTECFVLGMLDWAAIDTIQIIVIRSFSSRHRYLRVYKFS